MTIFAATPATPEDISFALPKTSSQPRRTALWAGALSWRPFGPAGAVSEACPNGMTGTYKPPNSANGNGISPIFSTLLANLTLARSGPADVPASTDRIWLFFLHCGPLAIGVLGGTLDTFHTAGLELGTGLNFYETQGNLRHAQPWMGKQSG